MSALAECAERDAERAAEFADAYRGVPGAGELASALARAAATLRDCAAALEAADDPDVRDCPDDVARRLRGIAEQAGKGQFLNALHRSFDLSALLTEHYRAVVCGDNVRVAGTVVHHAG